MPSWPTSNAWPASRNWPAGNSWPSANNWPAAFNGNFASLFTPGSVLQSVQSDLGITIATGVSNWADQSGNGKDYSQATPAKQPTLTAGLNGNPGILFDGVGMELSSSLDLQPPLTQPAYHYMVFRLPGTNAAAGMMASAFGGSQQVIYLPTGGSTSIQQYDGNPVNQVAGAVVGTWYLLQCLFSGSASDFVRVGPLAVATGASAGNLDPVASRILGSQGAASFCRLELLAYTIASSPAAGYAAAVTAKYGAAVSV